MKKDTKRAVVWWSILALTVAFIWGQSLLGRDLSRLQSSSVQGLLGQLFGEEIYTTFLYRNIRKVAHFAEYALLGMEWMGYRLTVRGERRPQRWLLALAGPLTATADELLQFISARAPRVTDVLLDCAGYACGMAAVGIGGAMLHRRRIAHLKQ